MTREEFDTIKEGDILTPSDKENRSPHGGSWNEKVKGKDFLWRVTEKSEDTIILVSEELKKAPDPFGWGSMSFTKSGIYLLNFADTNKQTVQSNGPRTSADGCLINDDGTLVHPTGRYEFL